MHRTRLFRWSSDNTRSRKAAQHIANGLAVQQAMLPLVVVIHQAIVASRVAVLQREGSATLVGTSHGVKVTETQGLARHFRQGVRLVEQTPQYTCSPLSRFVEQDKLPVLLIGQRFRRQFVILELVLYLQCAFEDC